MNNDFKKFISNAKKIELSSEKKDFIRTRLQDFIEFTPVATKLSPIKSTFYISKFSILNLSKVVSFALIVLIAGGSTISYASEDTLPGDTLYTVKVNFKEPIQETLAIGPQAKLEVKTKQVEKRLTEAQVLIKNNDLTPEKHKEVEMRVEKQVEEISQKIDELQEKGDVETILATTSKLQPVLKAHQEALQKEVDSKKSENSNTETPSKSETEVSIGSEENTNDLTKTSSFSMTSSEETTSVAIEEKTEVSTFSAKQEVIQNSKKIEAIDTTNNLLKTVEKTLLRVEEKENRALEVVAEIENNHTDPEKISSVTDKKVEQATKEISEAKIQLEIDKAETLAPSQEIVSTEEGILREVQILENTIKQDVITANISEAELLLEESKALYEEGLYKESLAKAQEAIKITTMIETAKKIETAQETIISSQKETAEQINSETIQKTEPSIKIEDQASQAIRSLESTLGTKRQ